MLFNKKQWFPSSIQQLAIIELIYYLYLFGQQIELFWHPKYHGCLRIIGWAEKETGWNFIILYLLINTCVLVWLNEAKRLAWIVKYGSLLSLFVININIGYNWLFSISLIILFYIRQPQILEAFEVSHDNFKIYIKYAILLFVLIFISQLFIDFSNFVNLSENYEYNYPDTFSVEEKIK